MPLSIEDSAPNTSHSSHKDYELPTFISFHTHDGKGGFIFEDGDSGHDPLNSILARYYQGEGDLQGLTLPATGSRTKVRLPPMTHTPSNARFIVISRTNQSRYQPQVLSATGVPYSLRPLTMAAIVTEAGSTKTEQIFAAGLYPGSDPVTSQDWKPDWMVLSGHMPVGTAKMGLKGGIEPRVPVGLGGESAIIARHDDI